MSRKRTQDNEKVKEDQVKRYQLCLSKKRLFNPQKVKEDQVNRSRLCLSKKRLNNPQKVKIDQNARQQKHREVRNRYDRLREFREATKHTAIFICTCCHQKMFHSNVQLYTDDLKREINAKKMGHTKACIEYEVMTYLNGKEQTYICKTCLKHMRSSRLPPMSTMNNLKLHETDEEIKAWIKVK